jgi:uncharacterized membrane protein YfcA
VRLIRWRVVVAAVGVSYFLVGWGGAFLSTPLAVYMVHELNAHPAVQNTIYTILSLPWCFKVRRPSWGVAELESLPITLWE